MSDYGQEAFKRASDMVALCRSAKSTSVPSVFGINQMTGVESLAGSSLSTQAAREQEEYFRGWVYTSIRPIAQRIAQQPLRIGRRHDPSIRSRGAKPKGVKFATARMLPEGMKSDADTLELIESHPLLTAVAKPNAVMSTWHLLFATVVSMELTGRGFWWMPKVDGKYQIWPIPASWMTPHHDNDKLYSKWIMRPPDAFGSERTLPGEEVVYFFYPDPANPFGACSPLQSQSYSVFAEEAMQESQARSFKNGIFPSLAVIAGDVTDQDDEKGRPLLYDHQRLQIMDSLKRMFGGQGKSGSYIILDALIKDLKPISLKPAEMDYQQSGEQLATRITTGFGTNKIIVGATESANRATSITAAEHFADITVNPKIELLSQTLSAKIGPMFDPKGELVIWLEPVRIKDVEATRADYELGFEAGAVTLNEYRVNVLGLPPIENGDACWVPVKNQLVPMKVEALGESDVSEEEDEEEREDAEEMTGEESSEDRE